MLKCARTAIVVTVSLGLVYLASGCAGLQRGPSDEELLRELLGGWQAAMDEGDVDKVLSFYSKDYKGARGTGYEGLAERMEQMLALLEEYDVEISTADANIEIEGKAAALGPVVLDSSFGSRDMSINATKEADGVWRITGTEVER